MVRPSAILMGTKPGSVVALSILLERGWDVKYVVVCRKSSHWCIAGPALEEFARAHGISAVSQAQLPRGEKVDFVISYMFRYRVKADVLALAGRAAVNFHPAPLPEFGGWAFYNLAILENSREYGCTCHYMDGGFDSGPLLKVRRFAIDPTRETAWSLERKTQEEMVRLFIEFCEIVENQDKLPAEGQDKGKMRYVTKEEFETLKEVPRGADEETVQRYARAFWYPPYEGAYVRVGETKVEVVPRLVKEDLGTLMHSGDLNRLQNVARDYVSRK